MRNDLLSQEKRKQGSSTREKLGRKSPNAIEESERWRGNFAADIQCLVASSIEERMGSARKQSSRASVDNEESSVAWKSGGSDGGSSCRPPSHKGDGASKEERSSGVAAWGELREAWGLDSKNQQGVRELDRLRAKHCGERKRMERTDARRPSSPDRTQSFSTDCPMQGRRPNPIEDVLLGASTVGGCEIKNGRPASFSTPISWGPRYP